MNAVEGDDAGMMPEASTNARTCCRQRSLLAT